MQLTKLKIIKTKRDEKTSKANDGEIFFDEFDRSYFDDKVVLYSKNYKKIFGKPFNESNNKPWKKGIVKICNGNLKIFRIYYGNNNIKMDEFGLSPYNNNMLNIDNSGKIDVILRKGSRFRFYWDHPNHTVRSAFKLGFISIILGIISIIFSIISFNQNMG